MLDNVKNYYGKVLEKSQDLQTNACCTDESIPPFVKTALSKIHNEVMTRYYGCGLVVPEELSNCHILDLGSGSGRDCYALAQMVGEQGSVTGVDMTDEQLSVANKYQEYHRDKFGYQRSNVHFKKGYIERLDELDLADESFDIIVSNCVINLSTDKAAVLKQAYRLLKPGGELYFSDVYADRRIPKHLVSDPVLYGECLSGALYWNDFIRLSKSSGFLDPRLVNSRKISIGNPQIIERVAGINFYSATYRLFKLPKLESHCEDYGQAVIYQGGIEHHQEQFALDEHHHFIKGKATSVCGNTWRMLHQSRFARYFSFIGNFDTHFGIYQDCGTQIPFSSNHTSFNNEKIEVSEQNGGCC
ncbi:methyltransferase domain-containing protein [Aliikangiella coralliicola]|uniref:Arsenite methyltransferase n=1 Tax=Aliikangiella coralliicola TaxID=2592383 RepID=A0A545UF86_9GAMM|nr:methyltransferase domain-containing protein [Aliikangiella coralliicola]TQV88128.1 methyltransferase domain-containing protein [Aliikangiella coralliicola]